MIAEPLVEVDCVVCGSRRHEVICAAREVRVQLEYLRRIHRRRLRARAPAEALEERASFTQDYGTNIVACSGCGLVFRDPRPPAAAIERAYARDRYGRRRLSALFDSQLDLYCSQARFLSRWLPPGARVVEVGSFVGGFLAAGRERGWEMLGVDPGREVGAFCAERGLRVFRGTLAEAPLPAGGTDAVGIWNTFDQLSDPEPTLRAARRLLRPGGLLALRVPNGDCFRRCRIGMRRLPSPLAGWLRAAMAWNNLLAFPYLYGYNVRTLDRLLLRHGLERREARPGLLARLAHEQTRPWAAAEERVLKLLGRAAAGLDAGRLTLAPWLDLYLTRR